MPQRTSDRDWRRFFDEAGISKDLAEAYLLYVRELLSHGVPPILDFRHLAMLAGIDPHVLAAAAAAPNKYYRAFSIPKRLGGSRRIEAPYPSLLVTQRWINREILNGWPVSPHAHGYVPNRSILTNAVPHLGQHQILKADIKDFFPSIGIRRVISIFRSAGYAPHMAHTLASLCCLDDRLPQGAATSPMVSNIAFRVIDKRLGHLAESYNLVYTRYADDLTFSGDKIPMRFVEKIRNVLSENQLSINDDKTSILTGQRRIVTGISVSGDRPTLPRCTKRKLRQELHYVQRFGLESHMLKERIRRPYYLDRLLGRCEFWRFVEPDNTFAEQASQYLREQMSTIT